MNGAVLNGVFPGAVLLVAHRGEIVFHLPFGVSDIFSGNKVSTDSIFDLASLTKPLATALIVMVLVERGILSLDTRLGDILHDVRCRYKSSITIDQLLRHRSGLPAHRPFYQGLSPVPSRENRRLLRKLVIEEPLLSMPGSDEIYSDLGYILLCWVIEDVTKNRLDINLYKALYLPLNIQDLFFVDLNDSGIVPDRDEHFFAAGNGAGKKSFVATEICPWRKKILCGEVHDDNAWVAGGVEGHAGLFGTACGVWKILNILLSVMSDRYDFSFPISKRTLLDFVTKGESGGMVAGFDTPSPSGSSSGRYLSSSSIGHLGFTGTSFWLDPENDLIAILMTNRVHLGRDNVKIKHFRPFIHDLIAESTIV
ncbi:MAG: beta-lactamase family protein [Desulfamplus sp.]|nr:beta-lactamase family protein [Desulfamplus sp.]